MTTARRQVFSRPRTAARAVFLLVVAVAMMVGFAGCGTGDDAVAQGDTFEFVSPGGKTVITYDPADRKKIATVAGESLSGAPLSLDDEQFAGKPVVINVWGSWCGPCRGEAADLERVYEQYKGDGVAFVGINLRDDRQSAKDFVADRHVGYPSIYDFPGATLAALTTPTSVVPTTIVLDRLHRPAAVFLKAVGDDELAAAVARVVAETPTSAPNPPPASVSPAPIPPSGVPQ